ncbi:hypothetical protein EVAR_10168_1 [Eumeta japonica]|uniref:Uncharacterized protein n=1 Tax=Eumeta variegata TaxID=151549 RepID=A0A4C1TDB2_EUMVA|nr:hypothetical protein EVAR_10168_1 [Eumeta japonica]
MSQRRGCAGVGPLIGRAVRDARTGRRPRSAQRCYMRARPATVSPPSTADEETLSTRVLKRSSGPPSARLELKTDLQLISSSGDHKLDLATETTYHWGSSLVGRLASGPESDVARDGRRGRPASSLSDR